MSPHLQPQRIFMSVTQPSQHRLPGPAKILGSKVAGFVVFGLAVASTGCAELRARHAARKGNDFFREGNYAAAIAAYDESQQIFPGLATSALNHGLACRQLMEVGGGNDESQKAADCALQQFKRLQEIAPEDERGAQLYEQTLFDANRYEQLEKMYLADFEKNPQRMFAVNALIQVYERWDKWEEGFKWQLKRVELAPNDPDAHYSIGVLVFNRLLERGGKGHAASYDPRPNAVNTNVPADLLQNLKPGEVPPLFSVTDIVGQKRSELADLGLKHLARALELRSDYSEAMIYMGLLLRQKALAYMHAPDTWQSLIQEANEWSKKAVSLTAHAAPAPAQPSDPQPASGETEKGAE